MVLVRLVSERNVTMALSAAANNIVSNIIISSKNRALVPLSFPRNPSNSNNSQFTSHLYSFPGVGLNTSTSSSGRRLAKISESSSPANTLPDVIDNNNFTFISAEWLEFAKNVSGEWDGYGADFTREGKPIELPENVVPEAYREWEVRVFDWQTQCPTLAQQDDFLLMYKSVKLLPTVGCEADAATRYTVEQRNVGGDLNSVSAFAYHPTGSYVAVWPMPDHGSTCKLSELEYCLIDPRNRESRVRIILSVRVENANMFLQNIKIFCEQWYGPFRNGDQLGGCAIRDTAFASTDVLNSSQVIGVWQGPHNVATFQNSQAKTVQELVYDNVRETMRDVGNVVLLPKQLWCSLYEGEEGETCCEVGWLLDQGRAITSKCIFSTNAHLKEIAVATEAAAVVQ